MRKRHWLWLRRAATIVAVVTTYYGLMAGLLYAVKWRVDSELTTVVMQELDHGQH